MNPFEEFFRKNSTVAAAIMANSQFVPNIVPFQNGLIPSVQQPTTTLNLQFTYLHQNGVHNSFYHGVPTTVPATVPSVQSSQPPPSKFPVMEPGSGTVVFPCDDEIENVDMDDAYDEGSIPYDPESELSFMASLDDKLCCNHSSSLDDDLKINFDDQEYWRNTKDCDLRVPKPPTESVALPGDRDYRATDKSQTVIDPQSGQCRGICHRSRKKAKRLKKQREGIDLTKPAEKSNSDYGEAPLEQDEIDQLDFPELVEYYQKLKQELSLLNAENAGESSLEKIETTEVAQIVESSELKDSPDSPPPMNTEIDGVQEITSEKVTSVPEVIPLSPVAVDDDQCSMLSSSSDQEQVLLDENLLREQLIRKMLEKRFTATDSQHSPSPPVQQAEVPKPKVEAENVPIQFLPPQRVVIEPELPPPSAPVKPKIDLSKYKLVIRMHNSDSEPDDENCDSYSLDESEDSETPAIAMVAATNISKLSKSQQREYQKLKKLLELRGETQRQKEEMINKLKMNEIKLKNTLVSMEKKKKNVIGLNQKFFGIKKNLKKSQIKVQNLQRALTIAKKNVHLETVQLQLMMRQIRDQRKSLTKDNDTVKQCRSFCLKFGKELYGNDYKLPDVVKPTTTIVGKKSPIGNKLISVKEKRKPSLLANFRIKLNQSLLKISTDLSSAIFLLCHVANFNFNLFKFSRFFYNNEMNNGDDAVIPFSDFTEISCELFRVANLDHYPQTSKNDDHLFNQNYQSVLEHFSSYRFFHQTDLSTENFRPNVVNPHAILCQFDLLGKCNDSKCPHLHQKDYICTVQDKILDMLTYSPQFSSAINVEELKKNPKLLREKLQVYLREKEIFTEPTLEELCSKVWKEIQQDSKISVASLLIRLFPKDVLKFDTNKNGGGSKKSPTIEIPFQDHRYNFKIRDEMFDLKLSQVISWENDPDFYIKNRFFAPEGIPITTQLEQSLATDIGNIQMWINLAYHHLGKVRDHPEELQHLFDAALNVLSRALEFNPNNSELYEHYLLMYVNKYNYLMESSSSSPSPPITVMDLCRKILKHCSTYRLWIRFFSLCFTIDLKLKILEEIIEKYMKNEIPYDNEEERSFNILEVIFNRINLLLHQNKHEESVRFFNEIFNVSGIMENTTASTLIIPRHRVFAWNCYIHLILYRCLPYHCFQLSKRGCFLPLTSTDTFVFDWKSFSSITENDVRIYRKIFQRALKNCCNSGLCQCDDGECFALRLDASNLDKEFPPEEETINLLDSKLFEKNKKIINDLHIMELFQLNLATNEAVCKMFKMFDHFFKLNNESEIAPEMLHSRLKYSYWLAYYQLKMKNILIAKQILRSNLELYFRKDSIKDLMDPTNDDRIVMLYEVLLFDDPQSSVDISTIHQIRSSLKFKDRIHSNMVHLYLCYLLYHHIVCQLANEYDAEKHYLKLDCVFSSVINSFSSRNAAIQDGAKILWFNYFLLLLEFPFTESHFKIVYENLRHICLNFNGIDPIFIHKMVITVAEFIRSADRLHFLIDVVKLVPDNVNLLLKVIRMALQQSKRETLWNLIIFVIYDKRIQLQCIEFWKVAISLSVERNDHLNTHKFFRIAITLIPYNSVLWEMFKNYETSIQHQEHLNQMKSFYEQTLGLASSSS